VIELEPLLASLADTALSPYERGLAARTLGRSRDPAALSPLVAALSDAVLAPDAFGALGHHGSPEALAALRSEWARLLASDSLEASMAMLGDRRRDIADLAVALARHADLTGGPFLVMLASSREWELRLAAVTALAWIPTRESVAALVRAHDDEEDEIVEHAAGSLASFGCTQALPIWLSRIARGGRCAVGMATGAYELAGDAAPHAEDSSVEWRRWWMRAADEVRSDRCVWKGEPAWPARAIDELDGADGHLARHMLDRATGIDFVDDPEINLGGSAGDVERARAWWSTHAHAFREGALYRAGRKYDLAPLARVMTDLA
jgi:hypothetical protein